MCFASSSLFSWTRAFEIDLSVDAFPFYLHTLLGILLFALTLGLIVSTDRLLMFIGTTIDWGSNKQAVAHRSDPRGAGVQCFVGNCCRSRVAYGGLILFQAGDYGLGDSVPQSKLITAYNGFTATTMPEELAGWPPGHRFHCFHGSGNMQPKPRWFSASIPALGSINGAISSPSCHLTIRFRFGTTCGCATR